MRPHADDPIALYDHIDIALELGRNSIEERSSMNDRPVLRDRSGPSKRHRDILDAAAFQPDTSETIGCEVHDRARVAGPGEIRRRLVVQALWRAEWVARVCHRHHPEDAV